MYTSERDRQWIWGVWGDLHSLSVVRGQGAYYFLLCIPVALLSTVFRRQHQKLPQTERQLAREQKRESPAGLDPRHVQAPIQGRSIPVFIAHE